MLVAALACAALLRASTAASLGYDATVRAEGRLRALQLPLAEQTDEAAELELAPQASLRVVAPSAELSLGYEPRFTWSDRAGERTAGLHQGLLRSSWRPDPGWQLGATADAARGDLGFLELLARPGPEAGGSVAQPVPTARSLPFERLRLGLGVEGHPAPRLRTRATAERFWEGGRGEAARLLLPGQVGWRGVGDVEWQAAPEDLLSAAASGQGSTFSTGPDLWAMQLLARWRHQLDRETWLRLGLGLGRSAATRSLLPAAEASLAGSIGPAGDRLEFRADLGLAPFVDRIAASVSQRATASLWLSWSILSAWRVEAVGSGARTLQGGQRDSTLWSGEVRGARVFRGILEVGTGVRALRQLEVRRVLDAPAVSSLLRDRAVLVWVALHDRGWLWR